MHIKIYKWLFTGFLLATFSLASLAQSNSAGKLKSDAHTRLKLVNGSPASTESTPPGNSTEAFWDIRFKYDLPALSNDNPGLAGVGYAKGKYWVSKYNVADSIAIFDSLGHFTGVIRIKGVGPIRAFTYDGQYLYAANLTNQIIRINPKTRTKVDSIILPSSIGPVRWVTYRRNGSGGGSSLFVGNYATAIYEVSVPAVGGGEAVLLNTIPASNHGMTAMYGVAFEENGVNSKFWVNNQGDPSGGASHAVVVQLDTAGFQTGIQHDTDLDFSTGGVAGGIGFGKVQGSSTPTLYALSQGKGLIGYDTQLAAIDLAAEKVETSNGMVAWPMKLGLSSSLRGSFRSLSTSNQTDIPAQIQVVDIQEDTISQTINLPPFSLGTLVSASVSTPLNDTLLHSGAVYESRAIVKMPNDLNTTNDTATAIFGLTDSTLAWDYSYYFPGLAGSVGVGAAANQQKALGAKFSTLKADSLTSVSYFLKAPFEGQTTSASVYRVNTAGVITTIRATTGIYTATAEDEANGVLVTLPFASPISIAPGSFFVCINELGDSTAGLGRYPRNYNASTFFIKWAANASGAWTELGTFGSNFQTALAIYPNFSREQIVTSTRAINGVQHLSISPNPTTGLIRVSLQNQNQQDVQVEVTNSMGQVVTVFSKAALQSEQFQLDLSREKPGVYFIKFALGKQFVAYPVVLTR